MGHDSLRRPAAAQNFIERVDHDDAAFVAAIREQLVDELSGKRKIQLTIHFVDEHPLEPIRRSTPLSVEPLPLGGVLLEPTPLEIGDGNSRKTR